MLTNTIIEKFYRENYKKLCKQARFRARDTAGVIYEEVVQEAFCRALKYKDKYDGSKTLDAWFNTILNNAAKDLGAKERLSGMSVEVEEDHISISEDYLDYDLLLDDIRSRIDALDNAEHRNILYMYFIKDMTPKEISELSEESLAKCKMVISRFKKTLRS